MTRIVSLLLLLFPFFAGPYGETAVDGPRVEFKEVASSAGIDFQHVSGEPIDKRYIFETKGGGVGFLDYDNDGWMDLFLVQGSTLAQLRSGDNPHSSLFRNLGDGTFSDVSRESGILTGGWGVGVTFGDFDNDGFADIYETCVGPNILYRNNGDGTFTDVTDRAGVGDTRWSSSAAFGDYDRDGDLDLYVCNYVKIDLGNLPPPDCRYLGHLTVCGPRGLPGASDVLYRNNGDGTFSDVSVSSGANDVDSRYGLGVVWADLDDDGDLDLYVANDFGPNLLFVNQGDGTFSESAYLSGLALSGDGMAQAGMGVDAADYDNDGRLDVYVTHFASDYSTLYRNIGGLVFIDATAQAGVQTPEWFSVSWGTRFVDLDNDGFKDIYHANGHVYPFLRDAGLSEKYEEPGSFYRNRGDGTFADFSRQAGPDLRKGSVGRGVAFADYDNDGDIDFIVTNLNGRPHLFRNDLANHNHWLMLKVVGRDSNRDGIGARITLRTAGGEQTWEIKRTVGIFSASDPRAHFGLGRHSRADLIRISWPGGAVQEFAGVIADRHYVVEEGGDLSLERIRGR